ncbi:hypothetical protein AMJ49_02060 [Parcubacteria bacterium DG_74_2]|nr:MAG: hypothetical protein AMJ49_02060 [Parcubacteria bacterium DG_74_2]
MAIKIYLGTWFQRTVLHLREVREFLEKQTSKLPLDKKKLKEVYLKLSVKSFDYQEGIINRIKVLSDGLSWQISEDGVILLTKDYSGDISEDVRRLKEFYENRLSPMISYLYSLGAPLPKELARLKLVLPFIIIGKEKSELMKVLEKKKEIRFYSKISSELAEISYGDKFSLFLNLKLNDEQTEKIIEYLVFFREYEEQLHTYLNIHRTTWERVFLIRKGEKLKYGDLPEVRSNLISTRKTVAFIEARIRQLERFLENRQKYAKERNLAEIIKSLSLTKFTPLSNVQHYIAALWKMTEDYLDSTIRVLETLYQENVQQELEALKLVTIISMMAVFFNIAVSAGFARAILLVGIVIVAILSFIFYYLMKIMLRGRKVKVPD